MFGCVLVNKLLGRVFIIHIVEGECLPDAQMRVLFDVLLLLPFVDLCSQVFHDCAGVVVLRHLHDAPEITSISVLSWKRRSDSDDDLEVLIRLGHWSRLRISRHLLLIALVLRVRDIVVGRGRDSYLSLILLWLLHGSHAA